MSKSGVKSSMGAVGLVLFTSVFAYAQDDVIPASSDIPPILKIGAQAPDFNLPGID